MKPRLLFAAGGTGGHLFPAIAVADRVRTLHPDALIEFIGTRGRLEETAVPRAGYRLNYLWISGLQRTMSLETALLPAKMFVSMLQAWRIVSRVRPHAIVCAGAYISYPIGRIAAMRKVPLVLMESNAYPGLVTRKLAPKAQQIHVAFSETVERLRTVAAPTTQIHLSGNPVRSVFAEEHDRAEARRHFGLDPERPTLFAFGGSLGARSINHALDRIADALVADGVQIIWQTGSSYEGAERRDGQLYRSTFIHEMPLGYAAADLILARAGATTVAELAAVGRPSILVPLPIETVHQRENAEAMRNADAAEILYDDDIDRRLYPVLTRLLGDRQRLEAMGEAARAVGVRDADDRIARRILEYVH